MLAVVGAIAPDVLCIVTRELERGEHLLVCEEPGTSVTIVVVGAILQEHANRFGFCLPNQGWIIVATSQSNIGSNGAEHAAKLFGSFPSGREGTDRSGTGTGD